MTTQQPSPSQSYWTTSKPYAVLTVLAALVAAGAAFYQAWKLAPTPPSIQEQIVRDSPKPVATPLAVPTPSATPIARRQNVCGVWLSITSQKKYNFVCNDQGLFEIYEVSENGSNKTGTGKITDDGSVEADLLSLAKKRKAQLKLRLSADGRMMEGSWRGDDPRESGRLTFQKV
jgi:hypothetical protein